MPITRPILEGGCRKIAPSARGDAALCESDAADQDVASVALTLFLDLPTSVGTSGDRRDEKRGDSSRFGSLPMVVIRFLSALRLRERRRHCDRLVPEEPFGIGIHSCVQNLLHPGPRARGHPKLLLVGPDHLEQGTGDTYLRV